MANILDIIATVVNNLAHLGQWDPQYLESLCPLSNTLTSFGCHSSGDIGILNTVDPLASVSNYYLLIVACQCVIIITKKTTEIVN